MVQIHEWAGWNAFDAWSNAAELTRAFAAVAACRRATPRFVEAATRTRLRDLLAFARSRSRYYAAALPDDALRTADLAELPVLTRATLAARFDDIATDESVTRERVDAFLADSAPGIELPGGQLAWTSSGSTGVPATYVHDRRALAVYDALEALRLRVLDGPVRMWDAVDERVAFIGAIGGPYAGVASFERFLRRHPWCRPTHRTFSLDGAWPALMAELRAFQPTHVSTYPTVALALADAQIGGTLEIEPREFWVGGESVSNAQREHVQRTFGARVVEVYGSSECMAIACACRYGALHVNADWVVLEPIERDGSPTPRGQLSHSSLITNLANRVQPLIRYEIGDRIRLPIEACPCGSALPVVEVEGRRDDAFGLRDDGGHEVPMLPLMLTTALEDGAGEFDFQIVREPGGLVLRLDGDADRDARWSRCHAALQRYLVDRNVVGTHLRLDDRRPLRDRSGKLKRVVAAHLVATGNPAVPGNL